MKYATAPIARHLPDAIQFPRGSVRRRVRRDGVVPDDDAPRGVTLRQTRVQPRHLHLLPRRPAPSRVTQHRLHVRVPRYFVAVSDDPRRGVDETDADDAGVPRLLAAELAVSTSHRVPSRFAGARVRRRASRDLRGDVSAVVVVSQDGAVASARDPDARRTRRRMSARTRDHRRRRDHPRRSCRRC